MKRSFIATPLIVMGLLTGALATLCLAAEPAALVRAQGPALLGAHGLSAAGYHTVTLYEGGDGGCEDTYIYQYEPNRKRWDDTGLEVGYKQRRAAIIKFDVAPIPSDAHVEWASLELYAHDCFLGSGVVADVHYITRTNVISEVTWLKASASVEWGSPGCENTTSDRRERYEDRQLISTVREWFQWDVTDIVSDWVRGSLVNNGVLLRGGSPYNETKARFASSEADRDHRPRLVVRYLGASPIRTPTPTLTSTPTNTPTNTPTPTSTSTQTPTPTNTSTATLTPTQTRTHTPTNTPTDTPTPTNTATNTPTATATPSPTQVQVTTDVAITLFDSPFDGADITGTLRLPAGYHPDMPVPLVVGLHAWGGNANGVLYGRGGQGAFYANAVTDRGWLLLAPNAQPLYDPYYPPRGSHVATLNVQHHIKEMVDEVCRRYAVDEERIYLIGISGGGNRAIVLAEKYPDAFAAAVDVKGFMDIAVWYREDCSTPPGVDCIGVHKLWLCGDTGAGAPVGITG